MNTNPIEDNYVLTRIRKLCAVKGWSIYRLSKEADISYSSLNNIFVRNTQPTIPTLMSICKGLGISLSEFFQEGIPDDFCFRYVTLSEDESKILEIYREIDKQDQALLLAYAQGLAKKL